MNGITESTFPIGQITIGETLVNLIADAVVRRTTQRSPPQRLAVALA